MEVPTGGSTSSTTSRPKERMGAPLLPFLLLYLITPIALLADATTTSSIYVDVCTAGEYADEVENLCPATSSVSAIAFNPHGPGVTAQVTFNLQPSIAAVSTENKPMHVKLKVPGFAAYSNAGIKLSDANKRAIEIIPNNAQGTAVSDNYNTVGNGLFMNVAYFDQTTEDIELIVNSQKTLVNSKVTSVIMCCFVLPLTIGANDMPTFKMSIYTPADAKSGVFVIAEEPILDVPSIVRGNYFKHAMVQFNPSIASSPSQITLQISLAEALTNGARVVLYMHSVALGKSIERNSTSVSYLKALAQGGAGQDPNCAPDPTDLTDLTGSVEFTTDGSEWTLFEYSACYQHGEKAIIFLLKETASLSAGQMITFRTTSDEFILPYEIASNAKWLQVAIRSYDGVDEIIGKTSVFQSDRVNPMANFTHSSITYSNTRQEIVDTQDVQGGSVTIADVTFTFKTNLPLWTGSNIYLRLAGFSSPVIEVVLVGPHKSKFKNEIGDFDLAANVMKLEISTISYSNTDAVSVTMKDLVLPPALYQNDPSLLVWSQGYDGIVGAKQVIESSPAVGAVLKTFVRSEINFFPIKPEAVATVEFTIQPSINFYQGDEVLLYLYGFTCSSHQVQLQGPSASLFDNKGYGDWTASTSTLTLRLAKGKMLDRKKTATWSIVNLFRLPDKLSKNDGILKIEGRGAEIIKEEVKKTPQLGPQKFITYSSLQFVNELGYGELSLQIAKIIVEFTTNTDILQNSTVIITLGGLVREVSGSQSGPVKLSGIHAPLFTNVNWDAVSSELSATIITGVEKIASGMKTTFFLERDQNFKLPFAMYPNDESLFMKIPAAGINVPSYFNTTTRVNEVDKAFITSRLQYGEGQTSFPGEVTAITLTFSSNVDLPTGTQIRVTLLSGTSDPTLDFKCFLDYPQMEAPSFLANNALQHFKKFLPSKEMKDGEPLYHYAHWNKATNQLTLEVAPGESIPKGVEHSVMFPKDGSKAGFVLPDRLDINDADLKIETITKQIIRPKSIAISPQVVKRIFDISRFIYQPRIAESTFMLKMELQATVDIPSMAIINKQPKLLHLRANACKLFSVVAPSFSNVT